MKIKVEKIEKSFIKDDKTINVLKDLSVTFYSGKLYAIVGDSGKGKSTFFKCLSALTPINSGNISFDDIRINNLTDIEISRIRNEKIGIIFQEFNLLDFLTTYENVVMPLIISGKYTFKDDILKKKAQELLSFVGLANRETHYPKELSGGEQQRVAIARALINEPEIILADEPTGSIDKNNTKKIMELFKEISKTKCVIIVTHDDYVLNYADEIYQLNEGNLSKYEK